MMDPVLMRDTVNCTTWNAHRADPTSGPGLLSIEDGDIFPDVQFVLGMKDPPSANRSLQHPSWLHYFYTCTYSISTSVFSKWGGVQVSMYR